MIENSDISAETYNVWAGKTITVDGDVDISNGNQLKVIASDEITINPGFNVNLGCEFQAIIDNTINY